MRRRYDLGRSDNYPLTNRVTAVVSGTGILNIYTGFPVTSAIVTFSTIPLEEAFESSSSSSIGSSSSSSSSEVYPPPIVPLMKLYVSGYSDTGFTVTYENVPAEIGFIDFVYYAV